ncbi:MAG: hypothetical protein HKL80_06445 [Acidimicrobiales bacterium]|nr:hypothetical protein [Acidimicrobiales bacterium]
MALTFNWCQQNCSGHSFASIWCHRVDDRGNRVPGAQSKCYLADPLLAWVGPRLRSGLNRPNFTQLSEAAIGVKLARSIDLQEPGRWMADDSIGYLRTGSGNEVDFAPIPLQSLANSAMSVPIESKWVSKGWRADAITVEGKFSRGIVATQNIVDLSHPV